MLIGGFVFLPDKFGLKIPEIKDRSKDTEGDIKMSQILLFQVKNKVNKSRHVRQSCCSLYVPLGVRDDIVTASTTRISSTQLNVLHRQLPEGQIVGVHVEVGEEGCSEGVGLRGQVQTFD